MTNKRAALLICFLLFSLAASGTVVCPAGAASSSLIVHVQNQSNNSPIKGATVTISSSHSSYTAVTDNSGTAAFNNISSGTYNIVATAPDYPTKVSSTIEVTGTTTAFATFTYTKAYFTFSPNPVKVNDAVHFNGSFSNSSGTITGYSWDFGDGGMGIGVAPSHNYTRAGSYTVLLTVTSTVGTATYSLIIPVATVDQNSPVFPWIVLTVLPIFLIIPVLWFRRRRYYVVIEARIPPERKHPHCPGDGTKCDECSVAPC